MNIEKDFQIYYETHDDNDYIMIGRLKLFDDHGTIVKTTLSNSNLKNKDKLVTVELFLREGWKKPHLHLYNDYFNCAIRLDVKEYFVHDKYNDKLTDRQAMLFDDFMREIPKNADESRWKLVKNIFNNEFQNHSIIIKEQPDYTMINYK